MHYPDEHPEAGDLIVDYAGDAVITEEFGTNYYNGEDGASELPENISIVSGKSEISIDSVSSLGSFMGPFDASIMVELKHLPNSQSNNNPTNSVYVEQWIRDSGLPVSQNNDTDNVHDMADWLEKQSWEILNNLKATGGLVSDVATDVTKILKVDQLPSNTECGFVTAGIDRNNIQISSTCQIDSTSGNSHRMNENDRLYKSIKHETRHTWQNRQLLLMPDGITGNPPSQDSDGDYCPEIVADGTGGGPNDSSPIQDGTMPTTGDSHPDIEIYEDESPYPWAPMERVGRCLFILEKDAVEFENE